MTGTRIAVLVMLLTGFLTVAGCVPQTRGVCEELVNCPGADLTEEQKDQIMSVCPAGLQVLRLANPGCYACLVDDPCGAIEACQEECGAEIDQLLTGPEMGLEVIEPVDDCD